jgi:hypothetical protein
MNAVKFGFISMLFLIGIVLLGSLAFAQNVYNVSPTIASRSCITIGGAVSYIYNFTPQQIVTIQGNGSQTINMNGRNYTFQVKFSNVSAIRCPVSLMVNSQYVYIPNVAQLVKIPSLGIELMTWNVQETYYPTNSTYAKIGIRTIPIEENAPITIIAANLTLLGQFLKWLGLIHSFPTSG